RFEDRSALVFVALDARVQAAVLEVVRLIEVGDADAEAHLARIGGVVGPRLRARSIEAELLEAGHVSGEASVERAVDAARSHRRGEIVLAHVHREIAERRTDAAVPEV